MILRWESGLAVIGWLLIQMAQQNRYCSGDNSAVFSRSEKLGSHPIS
jgi:hypothetical protein